MPKPGFATTRTTTSKFPDDKKEKIGEATDKWGISTTKTKNSQNHSIVQAVDSDFSLFSFFFSFDSLFASPFVVPFGILKNQ